MTTRSDKYERKIHKKGSILLTEKPFAFVLKGKLHSERCDYCFASSELMKCAGCSYAHYCDRDCQKKGWFYHKTECPNIKKISPKVVPDAARMLARIIIRLEKGGAHERSFYTSTKFRVFKDLMSHYKEIKEDAKRMEHFTSLKAVLGEYLGEHMLPNSAELLGMYGRMVINTFSILDSEMQSIGAGIYLAASVIDHSCSPNAVAFFDGTTIHVKTLKDLSTINWSDVYISYIDLLNSAPKRQSELESMYYFLCECPRCIDIRELNDMSSVFCENKECGNIIPAVSAEVLPKCTKCNQTMSEEKFNKIKEAIEFTEEQLENMKDVAYLDVCRICLNKQEGLLHPMNIYNVKILDMAMESCIAMENWEGAMEYGVRVKESFCKYYGELHPLSGIFLMKLGKIALFLERLDEAKKLLLEATSILSVTHGEKHSIVKDGIEMYLQVCKV